MLEMYESLNGSPFGSLTANFSLKSMKTLAKGPITFVLIKNIAFAWQNSPIAHAVSWEMVSVKITI